MASSPARPPHCAALRTSPSEVSQLVTEPCPTTLSTESLAGKLGDAADDDVTVVATAGAAAFSAPDGDGSAGRAAGNAAGCGTASDEGEAAVSGTPGPSRIPARRGQAIPTTNPTAAIAPTLLHEGRSSPVAGTWTDGRASAERTAIALPRYHNEVQKPKNSGGRPRLLRQRSRQVTVPVRAGGRVRVPRADDRASKASRTACCPAGCARPRFGRPRLCWPAIGAAPSARSDGLRRRR